MSFLFAPCSHVRGDFLASAGQIRPIWPVLADFGIVCNFWADLGRIWTDFDEHWPELSKVGRTWAKDPPMFAKLGQYRAKVGPSAGIVSQLRSMTVKLVSNPHMFWPVVAEIGRVG